MISEHISSLFIFGILSLLVLYLAKKRGFFKLGEPFPQVISIRLREVSYVFAGYVLISFLLAPLLVRLVISGKEIKPALLITLVQIITQTCMALFLTVFCLKWIGNRFKSMWKSSNTPSWQDFGVGMLTWIIGFPLVNFFYEFADILNLLLFGKEGPEQTAVLYLKMVISSKGLLPFALASILIGAPFIEEILFRGFLHSYLRSRVGIKATILLSSLIFALFHFSLRQEVGNFPLLLSLFVFALFLGLIYEKRKSLWASIGLHMTFNFISVIRIFFIE